MSAFFHAVHFKVKYLCSYSLGGSDIRLPVYPWPLLLWVSQSQFLIPLTLVLILDAEKELAPKLSDSFASH